ncbi:MAG: asparagine synthase (glutamine-hydrolyzing) [Gemmatimonadota bacterium]
MCGIAGFWHADGKPADRHVLAAMTASLGHRGPDETGLWTDGPVALGNRRLRVIDPEGGQQPMGNEDGTVRVVFNGEIYNHRELKARLEALGHRFRTRSDTEVIVHAYEEWGDACVERFNGMFAFALWDARRRRFLAARDRLGIKPLYVRFAPDGLTFGSELKAVVLAPWVPLEWDTEAVDDFLTYEYVPAPATIVAGVRKLPPATLLACGADEPYTERAYWALRGDPEGVDPSRAERDLRDLLFQAVERRRLADVPVGAFLSGGIDSSAIVAFLSEVMDEPVRTYSMGFADRSYDERSHARVVAERFGTDHTEREVTPDAADLARQLVAHFDEPFADVSAFATFLVSRVARQDVTVALSGDGGDELFAGYDAYRAQRWARRLRHVTRGAPWRVVDALLEALPPGTAKKGTLNKAKRFAAGLRLPSDLEHARWWVFQDLTQRRALYSGALLDRLGERDPLAHYRDRLADGAARGFRGLQRQLYADVTGYLPDDILTKVDRTSMASSLETRVPFLDHEFVEFAMRVDARLKLRGGRGKRVLRRALRGILPESTLSRRKEGFSIPLKHWIGTSLRETVADALAERRVRERGWFEAGAVRGLLEEHVAGRRNHAHRIWPLVALEMSLQHLTRLGASRASRPAEVAR